ncbi:PaaI family thioesterase [Pelagivirga sediminicola]|uniref:PaaI family thioesterase n=1 Tax=Pelagivirga sediminicola TaxID=2170575 RepID=A0A2T7G729_9RHOB|nr:PaaI family thioesterase [Pelagivirga sediminicola]PVA10213.1 PaaI family thioesterase [Pelagivirga sediminicola]
MTDTPLTPSDLEAPYKLQEVLGYDLTEWSRDFARVEADYTDTLKNRQGVLHGGILGVLLDTAMGYAGCYTGKPGVQQNALTLSMTVNFIGQVQGSRLIATGRRIGGGRKTYFAEAEVVDDSGARLATASGVFRYRSGPLTGTTP